MKASDLQNRDQDCQVNHRKASGVASAALFAFAPHAPRRLRLRRPRVVRARALGVAVVGRAVVAATGAAGVRAAEADRWPGRVAGISGR